MLAVKICGICDEEDALSLAAMGVWALGFIMVEGSPRQVSPEQARSLVGKVCGKVLTVGVFQDMTPKEVAHLCRFCGFDLIQLHGSEPPSFCARFPGRVIKAFGVNADFEECLVEEYRAVVRYLLFDSVKGNQRGGTGEPFPWPKVQNLVRQNPPVIIAGGLSEENLGRLLALFRPFGVDFNSRVEKRPGKKDLEKIKRILTQLKER